jgi:cytochrome c biogenesis protein CcmG, thiol:disulfide interchange protein DsbE
MYKKLLTICCIFLLAAFSFPQENNFKVNTLNNIEIETSELYSRGPLLINFWALWCEPCKVEMKHLQKIFEDYEKKGLTILGINQDSPRSVSKVKSYVSSQKISFPVVLDPNYQLLQKFNGQSIPYSLLLDSNGKIVYKNVGYLPGDEKKIEEEIKKLLADNK